MVSRAIFFSLALFLFNATGIDSSELLDDPDIRCHLNGDCELPLIPAEPPLIPAISPTEVNIGSSDYQTMVICVCLAVTIIVVSLILAFVYYRYSKVIWFKVIFISCYYPKMPLLRPLRLEEAAPVENIAREWSLTLRHTQQLLL